MAVSVLCHAGAPTPEKGDLLCVWWGGGAQYLTDSWAGGSPGSRYKAASAPEAGLLAVDLALGPGSRPGRERRCHFKVIRQCWEGQEVTGVICSWV